jgi:hypothetical protein
VAFFTHNDSDGTYSEVVIGTNNNNFSYWDDQSNSYYRQVDAADNKITKDKQGGTLTWDFWPLSSGSTSSNSSLSPFAPARIPGRPGPQFP